MGGELEALRAQLTKATQDGAAALAKAQKQHGVELGPCGAGRQLLRASQPALPDPCAPTPRYAHGAGAQHTSLAARSDGHPCAPVAAALGEKHAARLKAYESDQAQLQQEAVRRMSVICHAITCGALPAGWRSPDGGHMDRLSCRPAGRLAGWLAVLCRVGYHRLAERAGARARVCTGGRAGADEERAHASRLGTQR
jgi:hypothetical protein